MSKQSQIPTSTSVVESCVVKAPIGDVWHLIKLQDFSKFWTKLSKSEPVKDTSLETSVAKWTFTDKTVLEVKQEAHSSIDHYITYSIITAQPELTYTSCLSTVRLFPITTGEHHTGHTFVQWSANFSSDADAGVIADAKYKRQEALADLAAAAEKATK